VIHAAICDRCEAAEAWVLLKETKWDQEVVCRACSEEVDWEALYEWRWLAHDLMATMEWIVVGWEEWVKDNRRDRVARGEFRLEDVDDEVLPPTTNELVDFALAALARVAIPVYMPPFDSKIKEALRESERLNRERFPGQGNALRYTIKEGEPS
jgi:hypothetical protein